jgi:hypothetical protein
MKRNQALFTALIISGFFILSSCASLNSPNNEFPDDVYGRAAVAKPLPEQPVYVPNDNQNEDEYYDESYVDGYEDGYYASRLNRFYYYTPGMSYYDPFFDPWVGYSPFGYGRLSFGFGFGWGSSWYNPYYSFYGGWGYPYSTWGPYSYYDRFGYGYGGRYGYGYGYGYYPGVVTTRTIRTRPSNLGTDNIGTRSTRPSRGVVSSANGDRNIRPGTNSRPSAVRPSRDGSQNKRPGSTTRPTQTTRPSRNEGVQPTNTTRPTQTRPSQTTRPAPTRTTAPAARPAATRTESNRPTSSAPATRPSSSTGSSSSNSTRSAR